MQTVDSLKAKLKKHLASRPQLQNIANMAPEEYAKYSKELEKWVSTRGEIEMDIHKAEQPTLGKGVDWRDERFLSKRIVL